MILRLDRLYFLLAVTLFVAELGIGLYMHDQFIRPYGGDFLVVIFIYCLVKSFFNFPVLSTAVGVLLFAYTVEISQYFHLVYRLGLQNSRVAKMLLGTTFSFTDLLIYTLGMTLVLIVENFKGKFKRF